MTAECPNDPALLSLLVEPAPAKARSSAGAMFTALDGVHVQMLRESLTPTERRALREKLYAMVEAALCDDCHASFRSDRARR